MNHESLTKTLGLLIGIEWGVGVEFNPPFVCGKLKGKQFKVHCSDVEHESGVIKKINTDSSTTNFMILIRNKAGNNLVMLSKNTTKKLMSRDVSMRELSTGIVYKNEIEL